MIKHYNNYKSVIGYYIGIIKSNSFLKSSYKLYRYARGYLLISRIAKITATAMAFIQTSAALLIASLLLLIIIPLVLIVLGFLHLIGIVRAKRNGELPENNIKNGEKLMFIASNRHFRSKKCGFLRRMSFDFANRGYRVFIVNNNPFSGGLSAVTKYKNEICEIKLGYFFRLKRKITKSKIKADVTFIY